jgi:hypothetical protein
VIKKTIIDGVREHQLHWYPFKGSFWIIFILNIYYSYSGKMKKIKKKAKNDNRKFSFAGYWFIKKIFLDCIYVFWVLLLHSSGLSVLILVPFLRIMTDSGVGRQHTVGRREPRQVLVTTTWKAKQNSAVISELWIGWTNRISIILQPTPHPVVEDKPSYHIIQFFVVLGLELILPLLSKMLYHLSILPFKLVLKPVLL